MNILSSNDWKKEEIQNLFDFTDNLDSHSKENALIISRKGNFHNKWIDFEIDIFSISPLDNPIELIG